ncbi:oxidoreductase family, NAD-binding Rossmann fold protein [Talaromyces stipitatus ATCC 10500]|uniref:Oxidoreductase family, NAD-binding Rossmann fold protein n=1 Tax=Talaromyces stipitatus (strain ATCC 10500 / CBS 375.48 / QM 6759 / NRRL 1006) TaxID=441959 RepID=B8M1M0_TALSN|nr:oxidoreductase family, NAD-binding Rossmann fold protein [Talaromyces stipitatus ATCC 10500]EED22107.1 oxidoreductase family, NAD-binding Rossmann fold protein [Talaromyces stipitatus ATCC 10500]
MAIGVALIGGGIWAKEEHLPAILASKDLELKAIYSRSLKSANDVAGEVKDTQKIDLYSEDSSQTFGDILKRDDIQAVVISLPIANQGTFIKRALLAKKHVLSEKPVSENVQDGVVLISWYNGVKEEFDNVTWSVAENFRYLESFKYARQQIEELGKIIGFRVRVYANITEDFKFYHTSWRKEPTHQGGYILDGGVHFTAGLRLLLGSDVFVERVAAFTTSLKEHLPPVDTVDAILKTNTGIQGTFQSSVATTLTGPEWTIACENGSVTVSSSTVTVLSVDGEEVVKEIPNERSGVPPEVRAWGEALAAGRQNPEQTPEEGLADLELIELMLRSGNHDGEPQKCKYQSSTAEVSK